jgi:hypothetical protein
MARTMTDGDLRHGEAFHLQERRQKPVHPIVEPDPIQALAAERFERASRVGNDFLADIVPDRVGDSGRETAWPRVPPDDSATHDRIEGPDFFQEKRDVGGIVLQIRVHRDHDLSSS